MSEQFAVTVCNAASNLPLFVKQVVFPLIEVQSVVVVYTFVRQSDNSHSVAHSCLLLRNNSNIKVV